MREHLVLLPGWGLGLAPLQPLAAALRALVPQLQVEVEPLPQTGSDQAQAWLDELDARLPQDTWLGGWSLGGMLAAQLAARRGERCRGLLTLASNTCFVQRDAWPGAMPQATFATFVADCEHDPHATLKRFALLCSQGGEDPRGVARQLNAGLPLVEPQALLDGLRVLEQLDTRQAVQDYRGRQLHLFAGRDGLVPAQATCDLMALLPDARTGLVEQAGHAFILESPHSVAAAIRTFLSGAHDD